MLHRKREENMGKLFLFIIYSFLFLCVGGSAIGWLFGVSPFAFFSWETKEIYLNPLSDWYTLYKRFWYENWVVNTPKDLTLFFSFLFFFPLYIALWFWGLKVKWMKRILKPFAFLHHPKAPVLKENLSIKKHFDRPVALRQTRGFSSAIANLAPMQDSNESKTLEDENIQTVPLGDMHSQMNTAVKKEVPETLKSQIKELGLQYGYDMFENVQLDGVTVPLVLATDTVALLLSPLTEKREWIADEISADEGIDPTWFSAEGLITSPFYQMCQAAEQLKAQEPDSDIVPVVLLCDGSILNAGALIETWQEKSGYVALLNDGKGDGLLPLSDILSKKNQ